MTLGLYSVGDESEAIVRFHFRHIAPKLGSKTRRTEFVKCT